MRSMSSESISGCGVGRVLFLELAEDSPILLLPLLANGMRRRRNRSDDLQGSLVSFPCLGQPSRLPVHVAEAVIEFEQIHPVRHASFCEDVDPLVVFPLCCLPVTLFGVRPS